MKKITLNNTSIYILEPKVSKNASGADVISFNQNSLLKINSDGVLVSATAGSDYVVPSSLNSINTQITNLKDQTINASVSDSLINRITALEGTAIQNFLFNPVFFYGWNGLSFSNTYNISHVSLSFNNASAETTLTFPNESYSKYASNPIYILAPGPIQSSTSLIANASNIGQSVLIDTVNTVGFSVALLNESNENITVGQGTVVKSDGMAELQSLEIPESPSVTTADGAAFTEIAASYYNACKNDSKYFWPLDSFNNANGSLINLVWSETFNATHSYLQGDRVLNNYTVYEAVSDISAGSSITDTTQWKVITTLLNDYVTDQARNSNIHFHCLNRLGLMNAILSGIPYTVSPYFYAPTFCTNSNINTWDASSFYDLSSAEEISINSSEFAVQQNHRYYTYDSSKNRYTYYKYNGQSGTATQIWTSGIMYGGLVSNWELVYGYNPNRYTNFTQLLYNDSTVPTTLNGFGYIKNNFSYPTSLSGFVPTNTHTDARDINTMTALFWSLSITQNNYACVFSNSEEIASGDFILCQDKNSSTFDHVTNIYLITKSSGVWYVYYIEEDTSAITSRTSAITLKPLSEIIKIQTDSNNGYYFARLRGSGNRSTSDDENNTSRDDE